MKVQELMTKKVFSVTDRQTLNDAAQIMWEHNCGCVPVLSAENSHLVSVITDRDIAMASYINGKCLSDIPVMVAHSKRAIVVQPQDDIDAVEKIMQSNQIRRIPVIDEASLVVGIVSLNDIAMASKVNHSEVSADDVSSTLAAISRKKSSEPSRMVAAV
jgi:CBS domain-containing protein